MRANPDMGSEPNNAPGVERWVCTGCGSPIAARFDYLPDQVYVPPGIIDQNDRLPPQKDCHTDAQLPWLHIRDAMPRQPGSARVQLSDATP